MLCALGVAVGGCQPEPPEAGIVMQEFRFSPETVAVPAGKPVVLYLRNSGHERHEFQSIVLRSGVTLPDSVSGGAPVASDTIAVPPGRSVRVLVTAPPGPTPFRCRIKGHSAMEGTLFGK
jgi:uncharacterized cupredoxin-like copper-binding protein